MTVTKIEVIGEPQSLRKSDDVINSYVEKMKEIIGEAMNEATFKLTGYIKSINAYNGFNGQYDFVVIKSEKFTTGVNVFDDDLMAQIEDHEGELVTINGTLSNYKTKKGEFRINFTATDVSFRDDEF